MEENAKHEGTMYVNGVENVPHKCVSYLDSSSLAVHLYV
jgi:hypothetical protein